MPKIEAKMRTPTCPECDKPMKADASDGHEIWACEDGHPMVWDFRADPENAKAATPCCRCDGSGYVTIYLDSTEPACRKWSVRCLGCNAEEDQR